MASAPSPVTSSGPPRRASSPPPAVVRVRWSSVAGHLHAELPSIQQGSVHGVHCVLGVAFVVEADEGEAAALLCVAVPRDVNVPDPAILLEDPPQRLRGGAVRQVVHFEGSHAVYVWRRPAVTHGG